MKFPSYRMRRRSKWALLCLVLPLVSCATTGHVDPVVTGCTAFHPVYVGAADVLTDPTARAILANNLAGAKLCGWQPKSTTKEN